jgi:hypothetical protein
MSAVPRLRDGEQQVFFKAGGDWCYLWTPKTFKAGKPTAVVIHHHGNRGYVKMDTADWLEEDRKTAFLKAVMSNNVAIAGSHACGNHWGNPCSVKANGALLDALAASPHVDPKRIGLMGGGLGGLLIWNSVLGPMMGRVKQAAVMQAVSSIESIIRDHKFKDQQLVAYGLPPDMPDDEAVERLAASDPLPRLRRLRKGAPLPRTAIYHGAVDDNVLPDANAVALAEALRAAGTEVKLELFPGVGHNTYGMGKEMEDRLKAFFSTL